MSCQDRDFKGCVVWSRGALYWSMLPGIGKALTLSCTLSSLWQLGLYSILQETRYLLDLWLPPLANQCSFPLQERYGEELALLNRKLAKSGECRVYPCHDAQCDRIKPSRMSQVLAVCWYSRAPGYSVICSSNGGSKVFSVLALNHVVMLLEDNKVYQALLTENPAPKTPDSCHHEAVLIN